MKVVRLLFLCSSLALAGHTTATDAAGNTYTVGITSDPNFATTPGAFQASWNGAASPAYVVKRDPSGHVVYSTLLGAYPGQNVYNAAIAVNAAGEAFVTLDVFDSQFPTVPSIPVPNPRRTFVTIRLSAAGDRALYITPGFGGQSIAVDAGNNAYVAAASFEFPAATPGAIQSSVEVRPCGGSAQLSIPCPHQFIAKLDPTGTRVLFGTYLSDASDSPADIAVDAEGNVLVTGSASGDGYPVTPGAIQTANRSIAAQPKHSSTECVFFCIDGPTKPTAYFSKISSDGTRLLYSTFLGGFFPDAGREISFDDRGRVRLAMSLQSPDFPGLPALPQRCLPDLGHAKPATVTLAPTLDALASIEFGSPSTLIDCIADAADFSAPTAIAPGQLLSVFGRALGAATVTVNGVPAQILYRDATLINLVVPSNLAGDSATLRVATANATDERTFRIASSFFAEFLFDSLGYPQCNGVSLNIGQHAVFNADGSRNSCEHRAARGSTVTLFVSALPLPTPVLYDGGTRTATVTQIPGAPAGVWRVDFMLPTGVGDFFNEQLIFGSGENRRAFLVPVWMGP